MFLLDDDPLVEATPLVGVFCRGFVCAPQRAPCRVRRAVVAACAAFLRRSGTALVAAETCLVAVFCAPARNQPAAPAFFECRGSRTAAARSLDFACDLDVNSLGASGEAPRAVVVAALKRRPALAPPPPVAPPAKAAPPSPLKDDDSATTTTMDESTVDTRLKRATGRIRELEARLAAYEEGAAAAPAKAEAGRVRELEAKLAAYEAAAPAGRAPRRRRRRSRRRRRRGPAPAPNARRRRSPAPGNTPQPRGAEHPADRRRAGAAGVAGAGAGAAARRVAGVAAAAAARRLPDAPAEGRAARVGGGRRRRHQRRLRRRGHGRRRGRELRGVGVVRALRLPDASVGSVGPETTGGALEAAAYASMPLTGGERELSQGRRGY